MKLDKIKLKWKIFAYILIFSAIIILVFCLFQIFLLENMYKTTKINNISDLFDEVENQITLNKDFNDQSMINELKENANNQETAIYLFDLDGSVIISLNNGDYYDEFLDENLFNNIVDKVNKIKIGTKFYITFENEIPAPGIMDYPAITKEPISSVDSSIICGKFININNTTYFLILDARLAPVDPAVATLKQQLLFISVIVVCLSIVVALLIANVISKPIKEMNDSAHLLGQGKRDIKFAGRGYKEIVELNNTLNYAVEELKKTDELQKELLANISHDLRTPLTLIAGYAELMKDIPEENTPENINLIVDECNRLNLLVNDLLNLSRLQSKTEVFNFEEVNLTKLIDSIVLRNQKFVQNQAFNINFKFDNEVIVKVDVKKIEQVIYNFIVNAMNYSGDSKQIDIIQEVSDDTVKIIVKDYGIGIKEEDLPLIWNRYYRVDKTHKRSSSGTGLGLAIVKEILEQHDFKYGVNSIYSSGSEFYFIVKIIKSLN